MKHHNVTTHTRTHVRAQVSTEYTVCTHTLLVTEPHSCDPPGLFRQVAHPTVYTATVHCGARSAVLRVPSATISLSPRGDHPHRITTLPPNPTHNHYKSAPRPFLACHSLCCA